jgi:hypothetical protein
MTERPVRLLERLVADVPMFPHTHARVLSSTPGQAKQA